MRKTWESILLAMLMAAPVVGLAQGVNPNGFPSGPHYNLNIIGKKPGFTCPAQEYDLLGNPIYGNVVFVPESGTGAQINMVSGSTKGKTALTFTELQAVDPCAVFDGTPAKIQLPPNNAGYRVYARALAKPTDSIAGASMSMTPGLAFVEDETATDLAYIGLVTANEFQTPYQEVKRTKGKSVAIDIGGMFMWAGTVCYASQPVDSDGKLLPEYPLTPMCWVDSDSSGTFNYGDSISTPVDGACTPPATLAYLYCHEYSVEQWVFNIADLVHYFWSLNTNGSKLVQIRFYPN